MNRKKQRSITDAIEEQIVKLYQSGKKSIELFRDYELNEQQAYHWVRKYEGGFGGKNEFHYL